MNKQEVIEKLEYFKLLLEEGSKDNYNRGFINAPTYALNVVKQLKEQEKPEIPQFVADWYEDNKDNFERNIFELCVEFNNCRLDNPKLRSWFQNTQNKGIQTLVNMYQVGYKIKEPKERLYIVEIPSNIDGCYYALSKDNNKIILEQYDNTMWKALKSTKLTEDEIKENYAWAWQFAKEVE